MSTTGTLLVFSPERFRAARIAAGWSIQAVADAVGRRQETIIRYEYGRTEPRAGDLAYIAFLLGVNVMYFFEEVEEFSEVEAV